jgi:hypothetical protein
MGAGKLFDGDHDENREENKRHVEPQVSAAHTGRNAQMFVTIKAGSSLT